MTTTLFRQGERRHSPRYRAWRPLTLTIADTTETLPATLLDISGTGALIRLEPGQRPPRTVELRLRLGEAEHLLRATVLTTEPAWNGPLAHVRFEALTATGGASLTRLLADRNEPNGAHRPAGSGRVIPFGRG